MTKRTVLAVLMTFGLAAPAVAAGTQEPAKRPAGINAREHRQAERIKAGKADGQLTRSELDRLRADEAAIRAKEQVYRQSGGDLNKREYRDLERDLNRTSREIRRLRHNGK